jgi:UDP-glucose 4-epimerase
MRVLITGGAGFIGSHIADAVLERGHEVLIVDDLSTGRRENIPAAARFEQLDIRDSAHVDRLFADFKPEAVCHQAAQTSVVVSTREPLRDAEVNILGSLNLIRASVAEGVSRFVFASTGGAIYGEIAGDRRAREDELPLPLSPYACSKLATESYLRAFSHERGLPYTVLRYANVYGPRQDPHGEAGVVAIFGQRLRDRQPIQINAKVELGDDGCVRDYVYVGDVVKANVAALEGRIREPMINVCTGEATTTRMLIENLEPHLGKAVECKAGPRRAGDVQRSVLDPTLCRSVIGTPQSLSDGLAATAKWFLAQKP